MENQKHFHLVRYFAYVTAPLIIVCIIIAAATHRAAMIDDLKTLGEHANLALGQTFSIRYVQQLKSIQHLSHLKQAEDNRSHQMIKDVLDQPMKEFFNNTSVLRAEVFTPTGYLLYSTHNDQLNINDMRDPNVIMIAKNGNYFSEMGQQKNFIKNDGVTEAVMVVNTYMPITIGDEVVGIFQLYNNISPSYDKIKSGLHMFVAVLFILGLLFFYTVIYFVQKAERIIESKLETEKRNQEYLQVAFNKATESTKAKSEFLASMSHELRTPLNAIIGYSEILIEDNPDTNELSIQNELNNIRSAGVHLKTLIEEILDHAKIESGVIDINTRNCQLQTIINSCVIYITPEANKNNNTLHVNIHGEIQPINTDDIKVKHILLNLLSNANKFTKDGTITITAHVEHGNIILRVSDTGIGMSEQQFHRIFEPFTQIDNSYARQHGGAGLGLTISREYARAIGGDISVNSREGKGTIMELCFPYCIAKSSKLSLREISNSPAA